MPFDATDRMMWAAKSTLPLAEACSGVEERLGLAPFRIDCEVEGNDYWSYGRSENPALHVNLTKIGAYHTPAVWSWMWGAPDEANYQVVVTWNAYGLKPDLSLIAREVSRVLGAALVPYPGWE